MEEFQELAYKIAKLNVENCEKALEALEQANAAYWLINAAQYRLNKANDKLLDYKGGNIIRTR